MSVLAVVLTLASLTVAYRMYRASDPAPAEDGETNGEGMETSVSS